MRKMRTVALLASTAVAIAACSGSGAQAGDPGEVAPACAAADPGCTDVGSVPDDSDSGAMVDIGSGISRQQVDGVWVFHHDPESFMEALHGGRAEIMDGCLYVDDAVVVWHVDQLQEAKDAITTARSGGELDLVIAGGGLSLDEGASSSQIPAVITDVCPARVVWYASP